MKIQVSEYDFRQAFEQGRPDNFSYEGLGALFEYFEQYEADCGTEIEFDMIAICCDFTEYESLDEIKDKYSSIGSMDHLRDNTTVIEFDGGIIIQSF